MTSLAFFVPGVPSAQGSKRSVGNGRMVDMNKNLQPWRDSITWAARDAAQSQWWDGTSGPLFAGPMQVTLAATYARPKSHYRTGRNADVLRDDAPYWKTSAPDADKIARAALDAITASELWRDDAQVVALTVSKNYTDLGTPGLRIVLQELA